MIRSFAIYWSGNLKFKPKWQCDHFVKIPSGFPLSKPLWALVLKQAKEWFHILWFPQLVLLLTQLTTLLSESLEHAIVQICSRVEIVKNEKKQLGNRYTIVTDYQFLHLWISSNTFSIEKKKTRILQLRDIFYRNFSEMN